MKDIRFRNPRADEIEIRVQSAKNGKTKCLCYIDSRAAVSLLNETIGAFNWQTDFKEVNGLTICQLSIWDEDKKQWIMKSDTGSESNIEASKGLISDAYKRCLARWGFTVLYTAPEIVLPYEDKFAKLTVTEVCYDSEYADGNMTRLILVDKNNKEVFKWDKENGTTCNAEAPLEYNPDSKPSVKKTVQQAANTEDDLRNFFKAIKSKCDDWENVKPCITGFLEFYRDKLPVNNVGAAWRGWIKREKDDVIKEACQKTL